MVSAKAKKKSDKGFSSSKKKLKKLTRGAAKTLKSTYGERYRMNTKSVGKEIGVKKKHRPKS